MHPATRRSAVVILFLGLCCVVFLVAPETRGRGSAGGLAPSKDPQQRYLYVSDIMNNVVWIVNRQEGKTIGRIGFQGHSGGGFRWLHMVATDSKGIVYTGEVDSGKRVQKFVPASGRASSGH